MIDPRRIAHVLGTMGRRGTPGCVLLALVPAVTVVGCLDFTPITSVALDEGDGGADGSSARCLSCGEKDDDAGGCATELAACTAVSRCEATIQCTVATCFDPNVNVGTCLIGCETTGGLTTGDGGTATKVFAAALQCMSTHCQATCVP